jgi:hypothetical protein
MSLGEGGVPALMAEIGDRGPFPMPGVGVIVRIDPTRDQKALRDHRAAFLGRSQ